MGTKWSGEIWEEEEFKVALDDDLMCHISLIAYYPSSICFSENVYVKWHGFNEF